MITPYPDRMQDMQVTLRNIQRQTVTLTLPACGAAGLALLLLAIYSPQPVWALLLAAGMFALIPLIWQISKSSYLWAALILVAAAWGSVLAVAALLNLEAILFLLIIPVGLGTLMLGIRAGFAVLAVSILLQFFPPQGIAFLTPSAQAVITIGMLATWGMIWLTLYPL